jgi:hypothetical protein
MSKMKNTFVWSPFIFFLKTLSSIKLPISYIYSNHNMYNGINFMSVTKFLHSTM